MNADYLTAGHLIGPRAPSPRALARTSRGTIKTCPPSQPNVGNFDGKDGYVGFQLISATPRRCQNYGWAQLDLTNFPRRRSLAHPGSTAYETTPGLSILTGRARAQALAAKRRAAVGVGAYVRRAGAQVAEGVKPRCSLQGRPAVLARASGGPRVEMGRGLLMGARLAEKVLLDGWDAADRR